MEPIKTATGEELSLSQIVDELRYFQAHQMVAMERMYDLVLYLIDNQADDGGETARKIMEMHAHHKYKWPEPPDTEDRTE